MKCQKDPTCGTFLKRVLFKDIKTDIPMCQRHKYKNINLQIHKYINKAYDKVPVECQLLPGQGVCEQCGGPPPSCHVSGRGQNAALKTHPLLQEVSTQMQVHATDLGHQLGRVHSRPRMSPATVHARAEDAHYQGLGNPGIVNLTRYVCSIFGQRVIQIASGGGGGGRRGRPNTEDREKACMPPSASV